MEILDSTESYLHWDRNLSELSESADHDSVLYSTHFTELLDDLSQEALLGQLLSDPFLSGRSELIDMEDDLSPASPPPPHIQTEHSYSLSGDSRPQSPLMHLTTEKASSVPGESDVEDWPMEQEQQQEEMEEDEKLKMETLLCDSPTLLPTVTLTLTVEPASSASLSNATKTLSTQVKEDESFGPQIKLEPHEVDQFLNLCPKELEALQMPPTPPSSHGSDTEGSQSPVHPCTPASPTHNPAVLKVAQRPTASMTNSLSNSPLLTAPHKLQGSGPLLLTEEERRTLIAEGYPVPTKLPLSKSEEKALKKIRRKIKNKISAQESRRKKKEYMDALEKKVETCSNENSELRRKVENLESTNKSLLQQLHSLQALVTGKVPRSCKMASTQTSTCLMALVLCFAVFLGSFYEGLTPAAVAKTDPSRGLSVLESYTTTVKSRNLLTVEEHGVGDELHLSGLGGQYPEWDTQTNEMAMWRLEQQRRLTQATPPTPEPSPPFAQNNGTTSTQKALLIDLHTHRSVETRSNESPKVIELERTVNEPA